MCKPLRYTGKTLNYSTCSWCQSGEEDSVSSSCLVEDTRLAGLWSLRTVTSLGLSASLLKINGKMRL